MKNNVDDLRMEILRRLRVKPAANVDWSTESFQDLAPEVWADGYNTRPGSVDVYAAFWQLVQQGIIIPGQQRNGYFQRGGNTSFNGFPYFEITAYGDEVLANLATDADPADAADYIHKLQTRAPWLNETVLRYIGESIATFNNQHYLASAVLLGVAAETLLEQLYDVLGTHLAVGASEYASKLQAKRWASQRLEYARSRMRPHLIEFPTEFQGRVDQYLDMLAQVIKMSRDDVGHGRPLRVDRELAKMNLIAFPVLAGIIDELIRGLAAPCPNP